MDIKLQLDYDKKKVRERVKKTESKVKAQKYQPTWEEVWVTGYRRETGTVKKGIFQTKLSDRDKEKLIEVKQAIENGELGTFVDDLRKFTKTHALRLYEELKILRRDNIVKQLMAEIPDNYLLINTEKTFEQLLSDLNDEKEIAIDTETTGLNYFETQETAGDIIVGISITLPENDYHVYIPINHTKGKQLPEEYVFEGLKPIIEDETIKKILFNAKFDIHMLKRHGINLKGFHFDGMIAMKLLNENEPSYALKELATKYGKYFGFEDDSQTYEELFGKGGFQDAEYEKDGKRWIGTYYACKDTHLTYAFYKYFVSKHFDRLPKLKKLYYEIEKPILNICVDMEQNGFMFDAEFAEEYQKELTQEIERLRQELKKHFGDINLNSNPQLQKVLYDDLGLPDVSKNRKVDAKTLKKLAKHHEGVQLLLAYRDVNKLLSTYVEPLPKKIATHDNRLHGTFNQVDTATGRFASRNPNLQNLPYKARKMIIAPKGKLILSADYSQIEPRVLSHMSQDKDLIEAYRQGKDLYTEMAMAVFGLDRKYCVDGALSPCGTYKPRDRVKIIYLGVMYGMQSGTLSETMGVSEDEAEAHIKSFFKSYKGVDAFVKESHRLARENEFVETMYGRKRRFKGHKQVAERYFRVESKIKNLIGYVPSFIWTAEGVPYELKKAYWDVAGKYHSVNRQAVNTRIQGTSADLMKKALIQVDNLRKDIDFKILATVHDEILLEVNEDITKEEIEAIENAMLTVEKLDVPFKVDTELMYRWGNGVPKDDFLSGVKPAF